MGQGFPGLIANQWHLAQLALSLVIFANVVIWVEPSVTSVCLLIYLFYYLYFVRSNPSKLVWWCLRVYYKPLCGCFQLLRFYTHVSTHAHTCMCLCLFLYLEFKFLSQSTLSQPQVSLYFSKTSFPTVPLNLPFSLFPWYFLVGLFLPPPLSPSLLPSLSPSVPSFFLSLALCSPYHCHSYYFSYKRPLSNNSNPSSFKDAIYLWEIFSGCCT